MQWWSNNYIVNCLKRTFSHDRRSLESRRETRWRYESLAEDRGTSRLARPTGTAQPIQRKIAVREELACEQVTKVQGQKPDLSGCFWYAFSCETASHVLLAHGRGVNQMPERLRLYEQFFHPLQGPNKVRCCAPSVERMLKTEWCGDTWLNSFWFNDIST